MAHHKNHNINQLIKSVEAFGFGVVLSQRNHVSILLDGKSYMFMGGHSHAHALRKVLAELHKKPEVDAMKRRVEEARLKAAHALKIARDKRALETFAPPDQAW